MIESAHKCVEVLKDLKINLKKKESEGKKIVQLSEFIKESPNKEVPLAFNWFKNHLYMLTRLEEDLHTVMKHKEPFKQFDC